MQLDMAATINEVAKMAKAERSRFREIKIRDRAYLLDEQEGTVQEVDPRREDEAPRLVEVKLLDLESLIDWTIATGAFDGEVRLSRAGTTTAITPRRTAPHEKRDLAGRDFFADYMPTGQWADLETFQIWLDRVRPGMDEKTLDLVDLAFGSVSATSTQVVELEVEGATIHAQVKAGEKVTGKRTLPRLITSTVPFGDPAFRFPVRFVVGVRIADGKVQFRAHHDPNDGAFEAWLAWGTQQLKTRLPEGWVVLTTR